MRMLCVTSCTAKKAKSAGAAGLFYEGLQHKYTLDGIRAIRDTLGPESIDFNIISAKYGLLDELDVIEPYNVTFNDMRHDEIITAARDLNIHKDMQKKVANYDIIFYLLGLNYLKTLELPFLRDSLTNHLFLISPQGKSIIEDFTHERKKGHSDHRFNYFTFNAGSQLGLDLGVQNISLKGYVFKRFGNHLKEEGIHKARIIVRDIGQDPPSFQSFVDSLVTERKLILEKEKEDNSKQLSFLEGF